MLSSEVSYTAPPLCIVITANNLPRITKHSINIIIHIFNGISLMKLTDSCTTTINSCIWFSIETLPKQAMNSSSAATLFSSLQHKHNLDNDDGFLEVLLNNEITIGMWGWNGKGITSPLQKVHYYNNMSGILFGYILNI